MQLAIVAAGFTPGEADHLRRSMAAWRRKGGLEKFEQRLVDGMGARGLSEAFARQIYQQILGFGEYGFPESHSASFALLVYVSAWLKRYEPAAFCGALLNSLPMGFYGPSQLVQDARRHGVDVRPVDVTVSDWDCTLEAGSTIRVPILADPVLEPNVRQLHRAAPRPADDRRALRGRRAADRRGTPRGARSPASPTSRIARQLDGATSTRLADADALAALAGHRHGAAWDVAGVERLPPLLAGSTVRRSRRRCLPRRPKARTSSPTTGRSRSRCAGIRSRCLRDAAAAAAAR